MRYGVIGAGVLGLTAALRLVERGHDVTVLERGSVPGGLAASFEVAPGIWLERYYHHIFRTDRAAIRLIEEIGLGERLQWHRPETTVLVDDTVHRLDSAGSLLAFRPIPVIDRLRMAAAIGALKVLPTAAPLERVTADRWMRRAAGRRGYETVWRPLLQAKFGEHYQRVSMAWLWARIHDRTPRLGYLDGGFHALYAALADRVEAAGGRIVYDAAVSRIDQNGSGVRVEAEGGTADAWCFDRVISTLPTALTARLTPALGDPYLEAHPAPAALGAHCLILAVDRPLTGVYWIGIGDPSWPFLAVVEHTAMTGTEAYGGRTLVYLGAYRPHDDPLPRLPVEEQLTIATQHLRRLVPGFERSWIADAWSFSVPFAQPVVDTAFRASIPEFDTPVPGLFVANMFQIYPHDRGQNYSIELAERIVRHVDDPAGR